MLTLGTLIDEYLADHSSAYRTLSYRVRLNNARYLSRIKRDRGDELLGGITRRKLNSWYKRWSEGGKIASGRLFIAQLRAVFLYGAVSRDDTECHRLLRILDTFSVPSAAPRDIRLTFAHAEAIIDLAHSWGWEYMALGQALQYELLLKQKDVIGEWTPIEEFQGTSDVCWRGKCWTSGIRWEEIDDQFVLRHSTSARERHIDVDLKRAPMVMQQLRVLFSPGPAAPLARTEWPVTGPVMLCQTTAMPWIASEYRRKWRILADAAGVPRNVKNADSRAGAKIVSIAGRDIRIFERYRPGTLHPVAIQQK